MKSFNTIRIAETLPEIVDPRHSCLVVWDVQNGLVERAFNKDVFLARLSALLKALRGRMPLAYTMITPLPREFSPAWSLYAAMRRFRAEDPARMPVFMAPGSPEREIHASVKPEAGDLVLEKSTANIFLGNNFEAMMRARGIQTLVFTGIATEIGVETSARDASCRGFYPVVVSDCVSSADKESHDRSLANMARQFVVADSETLLKSVP